MLEPSSSMFILIPEAGQQEKILCPGKILKSTPENFVGAFEEAILPAIGADVVAFGVVRNKFCQQGALVTEVRAAGSGSIIACDRVGEIMSAEQRQTFRVSAVLLNIEARVAGENNCLVVDISPEGFGVIAKRELKVGGTIEVFLTHEEQTISTPARVQTLTKRPDGKFRYGFSVARSNAAARKMLEKISSNAQRAQLKRLAGAA